MCRSSVASYSLCYDVEKSTTFLRSIRKMRSQGKPLPLPPKLGRQIGRYRPSQQSRNPPPEPTGFSAKTSDREGNLNCNWWIDADSMWTSLRVKNSREAQSRWRGRRRTFLVLGEFLPPGDLPGSHKEEQSKLSECFSWGGKSNHHEIFQTFCSINQGCPQERLVNLSLTYWGFIRPHWPPGGEIPNCSPLSCAI